MSLYIDSSALLKRYIDEPDSERCERILRSDPLWLTERHTLVEVRRNLSRLLDGEPLALAREQFASDWARMNVVELDEQTQARSLDALHLTAASRAGKGSLQFLTFDLRQAQAARLLGFPVLGA